MVAKKRLTQEGVTSSLVVFFKEQLMVSDVDPLSDRLGDVLGRSPGGITWAGVRFADYVSNDHGVYLSDLIEDNPARYFIGDLAKLIHEGKDR